MLSCIAGHAYQKFDNIIKETLLRSCYASHFIVADFGFVTLILMNLPSIKTVHFLLTSVCLVHRRLSEQE